MNRLNKNNIIIFINKINLKYLAVIFLCGLLMSLSFILIQKSFIRDKYTARTTLAVLANHDAGYENLSASHYLADTFSYAYKNQGVIKYIVEKTGTDFDEDDLIHKISVSRKEHTILVKITATESTPESAKLLSETFAEAMKVNIGGPLGLSNIEIVEKPDTVERISYTKYAALMGFSFGLFVSAIYIFARYMEGKRVWNEDTARRLGIAFLGVGYIDKRRSI